MWFTIICLALFLERMSAHPRVSGCTGFILTSHRLQPSMDFSSLRVELIEHRIQNHSTSPGVIVATCQCSSAGFYFLPQENPTGERTFSLRLVAPVAEWVFDQMEKPTSDVHCAHENFHFRGLRLGGQVTGLEMGHVNVSQVHITLSATRLSMTRVIQRTTLTTHRSTGEFVFREPVWPGLYAVQVHHERLEFIPKVQVMEFHPFQLVVPQAFEIVSTIT